MKDDIQIDFESQLIDQLVGKMPLIMHHDEREELVAKALTRMIESHDYPDMAKRLKSREDRYHFILDFLSYDIITDYLSDFYVEDITINNLNEIYIHHGQKGFVSTGRRFHSSQALAVFIKRLMLFSGRQSLKLENINDIILPNLEGRVNIAMSPFGPQLCITKTKTTPISILDLVEIGTMNFEVAAHIWLYIEGMKIRPANILLAGGPGVGKTTLLNAMLSFVPDSDRMVVIEDSLELNTDMDESCSRLESDQNTSLADWVKNSLRMRPERIIIGEVRGSEAKDMITACNIGKHCMGTIHALTAREAIIRLQSEPMHIPETLVSLIDVFIILKRYQIGNKVVRMIDEISETSGMEQIKVLLSQTYKYDYTSNKILAVSPSTVYRDMLAAEGGMTAKEVIAEVYLRTKLLEELYKQNMRTFKEVTVFCRNYSKDPDGSVAALGFDRQAILKSFLK